MSIKLDDLIEGCSHFRYREFICNCGECNPNEIIKNEILRRNLINLAQALEVIRQLATLWYFKEVRLFVTKGGGYRCKKHSDRIKRPNTYHGLCLAADIYSPDMSYKDLSEVITRQNIFKRIGHYPQDKFFHLDLGEGIARWVRINGEYYSI